MSDDILPSQIPFGMSADSFADNPEPRCPCLLLLDTSGSMGGKPINELNQGIADFQAELVSDALAAKRVEVAIVTFGPVTTNCDFTSASTFIAPRLVAGGDTPMGAAILEGLKLLRNRKDEYRNNGISFFRPWIFLITDGGPTDDWQSAASQIREGENSKSFAFFAVGVQEARMDILKQISMRDPIKLQGLKFRELFQWLSNSMKSVSRSSVGTAVALPAPTGWQEV